MLGQQAEWGQGEGEGGSTVAERGGEAQGRTSAAAVLLLQRPFSASRFRPLEVVLPWHVDSGTRSSPAARREANSVPRHLHH